MNKDMDLTGVVLCGGESSRMGRDKGLLQINEGTWAQHAFNLLTGLNIPVYLSINEAHYPQYEKLFDPGKLKVDNNQLEVGGPLKGILSLHQKLPQANLLVVAVDMPLMEAKVLEHLIETSKRESADAYVFTDGQSLEPLCGIYTAVGLRSILNLTIENKLTRHSMHYILDQLDTKLMPIEEGMKACFVNCNSPEDLAQLRL